MPTSKPPGGFHRETIPLIDGSWPLAWQNIFFCEFDGPTRVAQRGGDGAWPTADFVAALPGGSNHEAQGVPIQGWGLGSPMTGPVGSRQKRKSTSGRLESGCGSEGCVGRPEPISLVEGPQGLICPPAASYLCSCGRSRQGWFLRWCPPRQRNLIAREVVLAEPAPCRVCRCAALAAILLHEAMRAAGSPWWKWWQKNNPNRERTPHERGRVAAGEVPMSIAATGDLASRWAVHVHLSGFGGPQRWDDTPPSGARSAADESGPMLQHSRRIH